MTSSQTTTAAGAVPAARSAPDARPAVALPGQPFPLGATPGEHLGRAGTNFALASAVASGVTLCLFDKAGTETQIPLTDNDADIWHAFVPGIGPGQVLRVPRRRPLGPGPGACAATRPSYCSTLTPGRSAERSRSGRRCSARTQPTPASRAPWTPPGTCPGAWSPTRHFSWHDDQRPWYRYADTVLYEIHVKGFTMRHPDIPPDAARDLRRAGPPGRHRAPARPGRHHRRAAARAPERARVVPGRAGA